MCERRRCDRFLGNLSPRRSARRDTTPFIHQNYKCENSRILYLRCRFINARFPASMTTHPSLSRRERQIMDTLYQKGRATAAEVMESLSDPPGYSAIRSHLATLEKKGHVRHEKDGAKYVFIPILHPKIARRSAVRQLLRTF